MYIVRVHDDIGSLSKILEPSEKVYFFDTIEQAEQFKEAVEDYYEDDSVERRVIIDQVFLYNNKEELYSKIESKIRNDAPIDYSDSEA